MTGNIICLNIYLCTYIFFVHEGPQTKWLVCAWLHREPASNLADNLLRDFEERWWKCCKEVRCCPEPGSLVTASLSIIMHVGWQACKILSASTFLSVGIPYLLQQFSPIKTIVVRVEKKNHTWRDGPYIDVLRGWANGKSMGFTVMFL